MLESTFTSFVLHSRRGCLRAEPDAPPAALYDEARAISAFAVTLPYFAIRYDSAFFFFRHERRLPRCLFQSSDAPRAHLCCFCCLRCHSFYAR